MVRFFAYLFFGLLLFAMATASSWFLLQWQSQSAGIDGAETLAAADRLTQPGAMNAAGADHEGDSLPVAVRGRGMSAEEIYRWVQTIRKQQEALLQREQEIERERSQLGLMQNELRGQQRELDGLLVQIQESLKAGESLLQKIVNERKQLADEQNEAKEEMAQFESVRQSMDKSEIQSLKKTSQIFEALSADKAADLLQKLIDDKKMPTALSLLDNIEVRDAAKILDSIDDPVLMAQLLEELRGLQRATKTR